MSVATLSPVTPRGSYALHMPKRSAGEWTFARKFRLWLADNGTNLNAFAKKHGFAQSTMHGWIGEDRKVPASALARVAEITRLDMDYWTNAAVPYPPPAEYGNLADSIRDVWNSLSPAEQVRWADRLRDPGRRRRLERLDDAAGS